MARVDSLIWFLAGFAQLLVAGAVGGDPVLDFLSIILQGTGGSSLILGLYFLIFIARHQKEFTDTYSKIEKSTLMRSDHSGELEIVDTTPAVNKALWYAGPIVLTFISAIFWLST
jgi:hypothetical protein